MAVLKDLIVHGASRFLGDVYFNFLKADDIAAETGYFKKLTAVEGTIDDLTSTNLTTKNATVTALLDVQGDMHTNSWSNSNIATIDGSFYITPTSVSTDGSDTSASNYTPTGTITYTSPNFTKISITGTFDTSQLVLDTNSHVPWPASSEVIVTGDVLVGNEWLPLGTIRGKLESQVAATNASKTISIIPLSSTLTDGQGHNPVTLEAIRTGINLTNGTSSSLKMRKVKVSLTSRASGSSQYPVGILLSAQGTGTGQTFIDIYGGNSLRNGQSGTINGTTKTFTKPVVRIGNLEGLPKLANQTPSGWGIYTSNGFFEGAIVAKEGYIGNTGGYWIIGGGQTSGSTFLRSAPTGPATVSATSTAGTYLGTDGFLNTASSTTYAQITNGVLTAQGAVIQGTIDATSFKARDINQKVRAEVNTNGLLIYDSDGTASTNGSTLAQFGSTVQIGKSAQAHINITSGGLDLYKGATADTNLVAHLGYGNTNTTNNILYYDFGCRGTGINTDAGYDYSGIGQNSFASGYLCVASGNYSHAEGSQSIAYGVGSHAEGYFITSTGVGVIPTMAIGRGSHAEGAGTQAYADYSHTEGYSAIARGAYSHVGGNTSESTINAPYSFVHGLGVMADADYQTVFGKYNETDSNAMLIIGNGTNASNRSNLMVIGNNDIRIGNTSTNYLSLTDNGLEIYKITDTLPTSIAQFGIETRIGQEGANRVEISSSGITLKNSQGGDALKSTVSGNVVTQTLTIEEYYRELTGGVNNTITLHLDTVATNANIYIVIQSIYSYTWNSYHRSETDDPWEPDRSAFYYQGLTSRTLGFQKGTSNSINTTIPIATQINCNPSGGGTDVQFTDNNITVTYNSSTSELVIKPATYPSISNTYWPSTGSSSRYRYYEVCNARSFIRVEYAMADFSALLPQTNIYGWTCLDLNSNDPTDGKIAQYLNQLQWNGDCIISE